MQMATSVETDTGEMIVKRVSVPVGLEELMEGLTKEVISKKPKDIYVFASEYFAKLLNLREKGSLKVIPRRRAQSVAKQFTTNNIENRLKTKSKSVDPVKQLSRQTSIRSDSPAKKSLTTRKITLGSKEEKSEKAKSFLDKRKARKGSKDNNLINNKKQGKESAVAEDKSDKKTPRSREKSSTSKNEDIKTPRKHSHVGVKPEKLSSGRIIGKKVQEKENNGNKDKIVPSVLNVASLTSQNGEKEGIKLQEETLDNTSQKYVESKNNQVVEIINKNNENEDNMCVGCTMREDGAVDSLSEKTDALSAITPEQKDSTQEKSENDPLEKGVQSEDSFKENETHSNKIKENDDSIDEVDVNTDKINNEVNRTHEEKEIINNGDDKTLTPNTSEAESLHTENVKLTENSNKFDSLETEKLDPLNHESNKDKHDAVNLENVSANDQMNDGVKEDLKENIEDNKIESKVDDAHIVDEKSIIIEDKKQNMQSKENENSQISETVKTPVKEELEKLENVNDDEKNKKNLLNDDDDKPIIKTDERSISTNGYDDTQGKNERCKSGNEEDKEDNVSDNGTQIQKGEQKINDSGLSEVSEAKVIPDKILNEQMENNFPRTGDENKMDTNEENQNSNSTNNSEVKNIDTENNDLLLSEVEKVTDDKKEERTEKEETNKLDNEKSKDHVNNEEHIDNISKDVTDKNEDQTKNISEVNESKELTDVVTENKQKDKNSTSSDEINKDGRIENAIDLGKSDEIEIKNNAELNEIKNDSTTEENLKKLLEQSSTRPDTTSENSDNNQINKENIDINEKNAEINPTKNAENNIALAKKLVETAAPILSKVEKNKIVKADTKENVIDQEKKENKKLKKTIKTKKTLAKSLSEEQLQIKEDNKNRKIKRIKSMDVNKNNSFIKQMSKPKTDVTKSQTEVDNENDSNESKDVKDKKKKRSKRSTSADVAGDNDKMLKMAHQTSFDSSKLREEINKVSEDSKATNFKTSFNPFKLRQEIKQVSECAKEEEKSEMSKVAGELAAAIKIQSLWRGFIVRKNDGKTNESKEKDNKGSPKFQNEKLKMEERDAKENAIALGEGKLESNQSVVEEITKEDVKPVHQEKLAKSEAKLDQSMGAEMTENHVTPDKEKLESNEVQGEITKKEVETINQEIPEGNKVKSDGLIENETLKASETTEEQEEAKEAELKSDHLIKEYEEKFEETKAKSHELENEQTVNKEKHEETQTKPDHTEADNKSKKKSSMADAVLKIQAVWRGFRTRKHLEHEKLFGTSVEKEIKNKEDLEVVKNINVIKAVSKIQALWRGYKVRKGIKEVNSRLSELQKPSECDEMSSQRELSDEDIFKAATKIQAGVRGYIVRKKRSNTSRLNSITEETAAEEKLSDEHVFNALGQLQEIPKDPPEQNTTDELQNGRKSENSADKNHNKDIVADLNKINTEEEIKEVVAVNKVNENKESNDNSSHPEPDVKSIIDETAGNELSKNNAMIGTKEDNKKTENEVEFIASELNSSTTNKLSNSDTCAIIDDSISNSDVNKNEVDPVSSTIHKESDYENAPTRPVTSNVQKPTDNQAGANEPNSGEDILKTITEQDKNNSEVEKNGHINKTGKNNISKEKDGEERIQSQESTTSVDSIATVIFNDTETKPALLSQNQPSDNLESDSDVMNINRNVENLEDTNNTIKKADVNVDKTKNLNEEQRKEGKDEDIQSKKESKDVGELKEELNKESVETLNAENKESNNEKTDELIDNDKITEQSKELETNHETVMKQAENNKLSVDSTNESKSRNTENVRKNDGQAEILDNMENKVDENQATKKAADADNHSINTENIESDITKNNLPQNQEISNKALNTEVISTVNENLRSEIINNSNENSDKSDIKNEEKESSIIKNNLAQIEETPNKVLNTEGTSTVNENLKSEIINNSNENSDKRDIQNEEKESTIIENNLAQIEEIPNKILNNQETPVINENSKNDTINNLNKNSDKCQEVNPPKEKQPSDANNFEVSERSVSDVLTENGKHVNDNKSNENIVHVDNQGQVTKEEKKSGPEESVGEFAETSTKVKQTSTKEDNDVGVKNASPTKTEHVENNRGGKEMEIITPQPETLNKSDTSELGKEIPENKNSIEEVQTVLSLTDNENNKLNIPALENEIKKSNKQLQEMIARNSVEQERSESNTDISSTDETKSEPSVSLISTSESNKHIKSASKDVFEELDDDNSKADEGSRGRKEHENLRVGIPLRELSDIKEEDTDMKSSMDSIEDLEEESKLNENDKVKNVIETKSEQKGNNEESNEGSGKKEERNEESSISSNNKIQEDNKRSKGTIISINLENGEIEQTKEKGNDQVNSETINKIRETDVQKTGNERKSGDHAEAKVAPEKEDSHVYSTTTINLVHTSEFHDTVTVPIPVTPPDRTSSAEGETQTNVRQTSPQGLVHTGELHDNLLPVSVQLNEAPPAGAEVLTSHVSKSINNDGQDRAQASNKDASTCEAQPDNTPPSSDSMESEKRNNASMPKKNMEAEAATKIQAGFRGYQVRKQLKNKISSPGDISNQRRSARRKNSGRVTDSGRMIQTKSKAPSDIEEKSAVKIQAGVRGFLVRRRQKKQKQGKESS